MIKRTLSIALLIHGYDNFVFCIELDMNHLSIVETSVQDLLRKADVPVSLFTPEHLDVLKQKKFVYFVSQPDELSHVVVCLALDKQTGVLDSGAIVDWYAEKLHSAESFNFAKWVNHFYAHNQQNDDIDIFFN